jgi:ABC-type uncharacterized transport system substrate-binding protein
MDTVPRLDIASKRPRNTRLLFIAFSLALLLSGCFSFAADSTQIPGKNVLIILPFSTREYYTPLALIKSTVQSHVQGTVNFHVEYLESQRLDDSGYENSLSATFQNAYKTVKLDVVLVGAYPALRFSLQHRDQIFPGVPIVFFAMDPGRIQNQKLWPGVTGVTFAQDIRGTFDLALRLHPDTQNVALITGTSELEQFWTKVFHEDFSRYESKLRLIDFIGLPLEQLLKKVQALPPRTIVFFHLAPRIDGAPRQQ